MMNLPSLDKRLIAGAAAILVVAVAILVMWRSGSDSGDVPSAGNLTGEAPPLEEWPDDDAAPLSVRLDPKRGPIVEFDEATEFAITPTTAGLSLDWELRRSGSTIQFVGDGDLDGSRARAVWTLADGNPQAHLQLSLSDIPAAWLADDLILTSQLPPGETHHPTSRVGATTIWSGGEYELSYSNWSGEQLASGGQQGQSSLLSFILWSKASMPGWAVCEDAPGDMTVSLAAATTLTIGASPPAARWPFAKGHKGQVIPLFDDPTHHPDDEIAQSTTPSAKQWLGRARTLAYGHSNPSDPRYGNGGLLGHGLGGTIFIPVPFMGNDAVERFSASLEATGVELAPRTTADEGFDRRSRLIEGADCDALLRASARRAPAVISRLQTAADPQPRDPLGPGPGGRAAALEADQLNGRLTTLLTKGLDPDRLDRLTEQRAQLVFSTPFVATRNPLVGAATEGLLEPERGGHWTIAARFAGALADLELGREASPLGVTSLGDAVSYAATTRKVGIEWDSSGALLVHNPSDRPINGFSVQLDGRAEATLDDARLASRALPSAGGGAGDEAGPSTLIWWDLQPGTSRLVLSIEDAPPDTPGPVRWDIAGH